VSRRLRELPERGVGFIYWPSLHSLLDIEEGLIDVVEVEPQPFWFPPSSPGSPYRLDQRAFDRLQRIHLPKLIHGVGFPVGGTQPPDADQMGACRVNQHPWCILGQ
jgi:uncharacterized protein